MNDQAVNRLKHVLKSARRLHSDAELLASHGRFSSAYALSLLSVEEIGKALIELWNNESFWDDPSLTPVKSAQITFHMRKQMAFACLLFAGEVIDARCSVTDEQWGRDEFRALYREVFDREEGSSLLVDAMFGVLNKGKERAFYADLTEEMEESQEAPGEDAKRLLDRHGEAIGRLANYRVMEFARLSYQHALQVMTNAYRATNVSLQHVR